MRRPPHGRGRNVEERIVRGALFWTENGRNVGWPAAAAFEAARVPQGWPVRSALNPVRAAANGAIPV
jgi:hypothetical protein